jgi:protein transport protein SEC61 subunit gamma-like protein
MSSSVTQRRVPKDDGKEEDAVPSSSSSRPTSPTSETEGTALLRGASTGSAATELLEVPQKFITDSVHLLRRCTKPDSKEYVKICQTVFIGFLVMGFLGYFIKLVHIPINNIIVGA